MKEYGTTDYISGLNEAYGRFYVLRKSTPAGDELIVIQASAVVPESHLEFEVAMKGFPEWDRQFTYGLHIIQTLLPTIKFGHTNWGHLVGNDNNYRIIHKYQRLPLVTEIPWCPLVDERDIEITGFVYAEERLGVWNGMEVDVFMAWDESNAHYLQKMMAAYRLLMERDLEHLAYRALGHVVRNGTAEICGLMTEASHGRIVEHSDKSAVYKAIAQIERAGLLFTGIHTSNIMLTDDGQVHLLSLCALMRQPTDPSERAKEVDLWHWKQLENVFKELELGPNMIPPPRKQQREPRTLAPFPAPAHGLVFDVYVVVVFHLPEPGQGYLKEEENLDSRAVERYNRPSTNNKGTVEVLVFDTPISARSLRAPRSRVLARATVPYRKPDKLMQELLWAQSWQKPRTASIRFDFQDVDDTRKSRPSS
ncbi:hypothetical protein B0H13DRAFT_1943177 [Mycena leptocephala]|nr:hypothetical protein B0H13DRAFT_1943177 [Mycena leptocephala]